jgi:hypothetical protein
MSFESPVLEAEPEKELEEVTRFSRTKALEQRNSVIDQANAYTAYVQELAAKSGKTVERVVAEIQPEVTRLGIPEFLRQAE